MFHAVLTRSLLIPLAIAFAAAGSTAVHASTPSPASGSFTWTSSTFNSVRMSGGNTIIDLSGTVSYTGTFSGTSTVNGTLILHADGSADFHDVEVFTGTVNGVAGTVTFRLTGRGPGNTTQATDVIIGATGGLAGLHGLLLEPGTVIFGVGPFGMYTGQIESNALWRTERGKLSSAGACLADE